VAIPVLAAAELPQIGCVKRFHDVTLSTWWAAGTAASMPGGRPCGQAAGSTGALAPAAVMEGTRHSLASDGEEAVRC
jgi:hypothetical protein